MEFNNHLHNNFRKVLYTGQNLQLVLMSLEVGEEIGMETYMNNDQFFRFESGVGKCIIDNNEYHIVEGDAILVLAGTKHNVINTGTTAFKMYTIYGPPNHEDGTLRKTKKDAESKGEVFDGKTTEQKTILKFFCTRNFFRLIQKKILKSRWLPKANTRSPFLNK